MKQNKKKKISYIFITILSVFIIYFSLNTFWEQNTIINKNDIMEIKNLQNAYFAWWCFWCMEWIFESQEWVKEWITWYIWWKAELANYEDVSLWESWHREVVKVIYNPELISFDNLIDLYWTQIDPTDPEWQFADKWFQYTTAIYYSNEDEKEIAEKNKKQKNNSWKYEKKIVTKIVAFTEFYKAEEYHQDYYKKSSTRYKAYKRLSWREEYINKYERIDKDKLKEILTPLQYKVTQEDWTEKPFDNEYWDNTKKWIYVDLIDWTPLFSSLDKYKSWTWWPSFVKPINKKNISEKEDNTLFSKRTEVRSKDSDSHLWHVFPDGPIDRWWLRYCLNSASLKFIPLDKLKEEWYWAYVEMF